MSEKKVDTEAANDQNRRSGKDRRQTDRRDPARVDDDKGIFSTRKEDRRKASRRTEDREPAE